MNIAVFFQINMNSSVSILNMIIIMSSLLILTVFGALCVTYVCFGGLCVA